MKTRKAHADGNKHCPGKEWRLYVTRSEKSRLPRTQQQDTLFHHQTIAVHVD